MILPFAEQLAFGKEFQTNSLLKEMNSF